jgi:hypothetical protein
MLYKVSFCDSLVLDTSIKHLFIHFPHATANLQQ